MSVTRKTGKKARKKRLPTPGETAVKDRVVGLPLGTEAQVLASFLRVYGADPKRLPDVRDNAARKNWQTARVGRVRDMPLWALDWTVAILDQIPQRSPRKPGRTKQDAVKRVERLALAMPVADAARLEATLEASQRGEGTATDEIEKRARNLQNRAYRRPKTKTDMT